MKAVRQSHMRGRSTKRRLAPRSFAQHLEPRIVVALPMPPKEIALRAGACASVAAQHVASTRWGGARGGGRWGGGPLPGGRGGAPRGGAAPGRPGGGRRGVGGPRGVASGGGRAQRGGRVARASDHRQTGSGGAPWGPRVEPGACRPSGVAGKRSFPSTTASPGWRFLDAAQPIPAPARAPRAPSADRR